MTNPCSSAARKKKKEADVLSFVLVRSRTLKNSYQIKYN
jgi:hypothetical protein